VGGGRAGPVGVEPAWLDQRDRDTDASHPAERTLTVVDDIANPDSAAQLINTVTAHFGRIDVVVSNAAPTPAATQPRSPAHSGQHSARLNGD